MADLRPRIERLVGRLADGPAGRNEGRAGGSPPVLRPGDPGFAEAVARLAAMPLDQYAREGALLEIRAPGFEETLWLVPDEARAEVLVHEGTSRGRIWAGSELMRLMAVPGDRRKTLRATARVKLAFEGTVVEVAGP